jgi:hypothetical protein
MGQEPIIRRLLPQSMIDERKLPLVADEFLAEALDAGGGRDDLEEAVLGHIAQAHGRFIERAAPVHKAKCSTA